MNKTFSKILIYLLLLIKNILFILTLILPMFIINSLIVKNVKLIFIYIFVQFILFILDIIVGYFYNIFIETYLEDKKIELIDKIICKITKQENSKLKNKEKYISWLLNDVNILKYEYFKPEIEILFSILKSLVFLIGLLYFNFVLFLINLIGTIIITIYTNKKSNSYKNINIDISKFLEIKTKYITNMFENIFPFFLSNNMKIFKIKNIQYCKNYLFNLKTILRPLYIFLMNKNIVIILIQVINIIIAIYYISIGKLDLGAYSVIGSFSGYLTNTFNEVVQSYILIKKSKNLIKKYDKEIINENVGKYSIKDIETIELKNISIDNIYNNFNYIFEKNKKYLIIGESGSGKSTLINLILKNILNYNGKIFINKIDLNEINKYSIYSNIDYINSDNFIFYSNIYDNIGIYSKDIDENKINEIMKKINLDIDYEINEKNISLGQKQRLNLVKALYNNKKMIILDEATSNLDKENRGIIENIFLSLNKTIVFITHYYDEEFIKKFDEVLLLKKGGTYERLIISK